MFNKWEALQGQWETTFGDPDEMSEMQFVAQTVSTLCFGMLDRGIEFPGFPLALENLEYLEKREKFFQSGKSQGILKF